MGAQFSSVSVANILQNYTNALNVEQVMKHIDVIIQNENNIIIRNVRNVRNNKFNQATLVRNQIIGSTILKDAKKLGFYDNIKSEYDKTQSKSGVFEVQATNSVMENLIQNHVNMTEILDIKENIRASFKIGNSFIVENDILVPGDNVENNDLVQMNQTFNDEYQKYLKDTITELTAEGKIKAKVDEDIKADGLLSTGFMMWLALGAAAIAGIYVTSKTKK
jgi:hypothetical protein